MDDYIQSFTNFHQQRMNKLSGKASLCEKCNSEKVFIDSRESLIINCPKCGNLLNIQLPIYNDHIIQLDDIHNKINEDFNYNIINNYIDVGEKIISQSKLIEELNQAKLILNNNFDKKYNLNADNINKNYKSLLRYKNNLQSIFKDIQKNNDTAKEKNLINQYIENISDMNHCYQLINQYSNNIDYISIIKEPSINKKMDNIQPFSISDAVQWDIKGNTFTGIIDKIDGNKAYIIDDKDNATKKIPINKLIKRNKEIIEGNSLYNPNTIFQFYSKSIDKPPGMGLGEKVPKELISDYSKLNEILNWRWALDNSYHAEFTLDDLKWLSVEHFYQASKFKNDNYDFYYLFSLNSSSDISNDAELAKAAGSKSGIFKGKNIRKSGVIIDADFFQGRNSEVLEYAIYAKFSQNKTLSNILLFTNDAKLIQFNKKGNKVAHELMKVRQILKEEYNDKKIFEIGSKVKWNIKKNTFTGTINKIDGNKAYIIDDKDDSIKKIPIDILSIF